MLRPSFFEALVSFFILLASAFSVIFFGYLAYKLLCSG